MEMNISRRGFLKAGASAAAVLIVGVNADGVLASSAQTKAFNPFVSIDGDGVVTVIVKHFEMGQGTTTGLATLVAEELDADWNSLRTEYAPSDNERYKNLAFGAQGTGGSSAIANSFMQYRQAGAAVRDMLVRAAAQKWNVDASTISFENGKIMSGGKTAGFGEVVELAATMTPAEAPALKDPKTFKLIGNVSVPRKDSFDKTNGSGLFAMDIQIPGMVHAVIKRSPKFGGVLTGFDATAAEKVNGYIDAKALPSNAGVVVYAKNTWAAFKARDAVTAQWDFGKAETRGTDEMVKAHHDLAASPQYQARKDMDTAKAETLNAFAAKVIEADFTLPFLAHAPMETLNCVIEPTDGGVMVHDGCQFPAITHPAVAGILQLKPEQVRINTVYAGGSFGRRATTTADYHVEAAFAFALMGQKTPVKLVWSREDDIRGGYYRPMAVHKAKIGLDADGKITAWDHRIAVKSIIKGTPLEQGFVHDGVDHVSVEGVADTLYQVPNMAVGLSDFTSPVPVLWWRSVGHTHTAHAMESLLDMVAHETKQDPVALRLGMLDKSDARQARLAGVIEAARDASGWKPGQKRGFACHFSFNSHVAAVADVTVNGNEVHVDKILLAVDCGVAVNPDVIRAQMEGGAGYGLGAILRNQITFDKGEVVEENFPDYEPLRIGDMPEIEVVVVKSAEAPTGVGEPGVPPTGPAVANAIFAVSGKRVTDLPMTNSGLEFV